MVAPGARTPAARSPDLFARLRERVVVLLADGIAEGSLPPDLDFGRFSVAPSPLSDGCDLVTDAAPVYAREAALVGADPLRLARALAAGLAAEAEVAAAAVVGPGLVAVTFRRRAVLGVVASLLRHGAEPVPCRRIGTASSGAPSRALLTLDEARAAALADMIASLSAATGRRPPEPPAACGRVLVKDPDETARVGRDAFRFAVASRRPDAPLHLDIAALSDRSRANPAFWVPYAHARNRAVLRRAAAALPTLDLSPKALAEADLSVLTDEAEITLARLLVRFPHVVATASAASAPRRLAAYLCDLANAVHSQWNRSKDQPQLRFVNEEQRDLIEARLGLVTASTLVLSSGLGILGVSAPDEMP